MLAIYIVYTGNKLISLTSDSTRFHQYETLCGIKGVQESQTTWKEQNVLALGTITLNIFFIEYGTVITRQQDSVK